MTNNSNMASKSTFSSNGRSAFPELSGSLFFKKDLTNAIEVYDFDENAIIAKMERMMQLIDEAL